MRILGHTWIYLYVLTFDMCGPTSLTSNALFRPAIGIMVRVLPSSSGDQGSIPGRVLAMVHIMLLDASLLNSQYYKVRIKGKWAIPGKGIASSLTQRSSSYCKGKFGGKTWLEIANLCLVILRLFQISMFFFNDNITYSLKDFPHLQASSIVVVTCLKTFSIMNSKSLHFSF